MIVAAPPVPSPNEPLTEVVEAELLSVTLTVRAMLFIRD